MCTPKLHIYTGTDDQKGLKTLPCVRLFFCVVKLKVIDVVATWNSLCVVYHYFPRSCDTLRLSKLLS